MPRSFDRELAQVFGGLTCCWQLDANARQASATDAEAEIFAALQELKEGDAGLIANHLGNKTRQAVAKVANRMEPGGKLVSRIESGARIYRAVAGSSRRQYSLGKCNGLHGLHGLQLVGSEV